MCCGQLGRGNLQFSGLLKGTTRQLCQGGESSLIKVTVCSCFVTFNKS
jgi:hypothetical protein